MYSSPACNDNLGTRHDTPEKRPNSTASSSSLASSFNKDPIESDTHEPRKSNVDATCLGLPPRQVKDTQLASPRQDDQPGDAAVMQCPPKQAMDRIDHDPATTPSTYRIPSHVFARTISTAPNEWSVASSESLFSIHPGNMSFTGDQLFYYKSGELGLPDECTIPGSSADLAPSTPTNKSTEVVQESDNLDDARFGVTEATAAETMMEVISENEEDPLKTKPASVEELLYSSANLGSHSIRSDDSMGRVKSFAFPILTGMDKSGSSRPGKILKQPQSQPETPKESPKAMPPQTKDEEVSLTGSKLEPSRSNAAAARKNKMCCFSCC